MVNRMHNSIIATAGIAFVWLVDHMEQMGHVNFWLALIVAAVLCGKAGRAVFRIVVRGDP